MKLFNFDVHITRRGNWPLAWGKRPRFAVEACEGSLDDWEVYCGPWEAVVSRMQNRKGTIRS